MDIAGVMKGEGEVPYLPQGMAGKLSFDAFPDINF